MTPAQHRANILAWVDTRQSVSGVTHFATAYASLRVLVLAIACYLDEVKS